MSTRDWRRRGFTLIEVIVATTMMVAIAAAAVGVLATTYRAQAEGAERNKLARDAALVGDMLARDLMHAGVGVPRGFRADTNDFVGGLREEHQLRPIFRRFKADHLALVGDLPYPNADLNGIAAIAHIGPGGDHRLYVTSELSPCVPPSSSPGDYRCDSHTASLLGPFPVGDRCVAGQPLRRTCPWGMNKWQEGSRDIHLVVSAPNHSWFEREWERSSTDTEGPYFGMHLEHAAPGGNTWDSSGVPNLPVNQFFQPRGGGFVAQVDRVFWSLENPGAPGSACTATTPPFCVLRRRQCWGAIVDPAAATFPAVGDTAFRANQVPTECTAPADGTEWEEVIDGVRSLGLQAFDGQGAALGAPWDLQTAAKVKTVAFEVVLEARVPGTSKTLTERIAKRVLVRNRGGILGAPAANGGCDTTIDVGACGGDDI